MDSKKEILALLPRIVPEEDIERDGSISGYTIGEDGKLFQGGKYANIQYDTKYLLWRLDLPYDEVCEYINILYENFGGCKNSRKTIRLHGNTVVNCFQFCNLEAAKTVIGFLMAEAALL